MTSLSANPRKIGVSQHLLPSVRTILIWPERSLNQPCEEVTEFDDKLGQLLSDMCLTMTENNGLGLAAPQVGVNQNIITVGIRKHYPSGEQATDITPIQDETSFVDFKVLINPRILATSEQTMQYEEGCLSVPGYFENRTRSQTIIVEYQDTGERRHSEEFEGLEAFVIQHEIDHLSGHLFIDGLSKLKKDRIKKKVSKSMYLLKGNTVAL